MTDRTEHPTQSPQMPVTLEDLQTWLPTDWHDPLQDLAATTVQATTPLKLSLVGAFSVGKSSLLNMLMGDTVLQTSRQETTALPTFIEHGETRAMQLIGTQGAVTSLSDEAFAVATTSAPEGAACAVLQQPLEWLRGVCIVDLPGTGSMSDTHRDFTKAQIQQSDAVLYLLNPTGPSARDVELLTQIRQSGKQVEIWVNRWDEVEAAVAEGEKAPSLEAWSDEIARQTGLRRQLHTASKRGMGREEIIAFVVRTRDELARVRQQRFLAEAGPLLERALAQNADLQRACTAQSDADIARIQTELLERRQALLALKAGLHDQASTDRATAANQATATIDTGRNQLRQQLTPLKAQEEAQWNSFLERGSRVLQGALSQTAQALSDASAHYGRTNLTPAQLEVLQIQIPPAEAISVDDFLDMGRMARLQAALQAKAEEVDAKSQHLNSLPTTDTRTQEEALNEVRRARQALADEELPTIVQSPSAGHRTTGTLVGRILGEVADIGLMLVNPVTIGAKVAALIGKGAKVINVTTKTAKMARQVATGIQVAQQLRKGQLPPDALLPPPVIMDKLGMLEKLSFAYWGEQVGKMLDSPPTAVEVTDTAALAEREQAMAAMDAQCRALQAELNHAQEMAAEREMTGWALAQNQKEQAQLQADLATQQARAREQAQAHERMAQRERSDLLERYEQRAKEHWLQTFNQQTEGMAELLHGRARSHWEQHIEASIAESMAGVDQLTEQLKSEPGTKQAKLAQLQQSETLLKAGLAKVKA